MGFALLVEIVMVEETGVRGGNNRYVLRTENSFC
jgi:hypothetical protein